MAVETMEREGEAGAVKDGRDVRRAEDTSRERLRHVQLRLGRSKTGRKGGRAPPWTPRGQGLTFV